MTVLVSQRHILVILVAGKCVVLFYYLKITRVKHALTESRPPLWWRESEVWVIYKGFMGNTCFLVLAVRTEIAKRNLQLSWIALLNSTQEVNETTWCFDCSFNPQKLIFLPPIPPEVFQEDMNTYCSLELKAKPSFHFQIVLNYFLKAAKLWRMARLV